jgi:dihydrofolate reductase
LSRGQGQIYAKTIGRAERLLITEVALEAKGEARFPSIDPANGRRESGERGPWDEADFAFVEHEWRT